jgi:hypothetical protein
MLYKKYVIEVIYNIDVIEKGTITSNNVYDNQIQLNFSPIIKNINVIKFVAEDGIIQDYKYIFDTYEEAFNVLSTHYYTLNSDIDVQTLKISTVYDDIIPPLEVLRSMKIKQILK